MLTLDGKVALIVGGASGIGAATAALMARLGARVVIADTDLGRAVDRVREIKGEGGVAAAVETDVRSEESVKSAVGSAVASFGRLDVLHNNAADVGIIGADHDIANVSLENWDASLRADLTGAMFGCKHAVPVMIAGGGGSIINTASVSGIGAEVYMSAYPVAKAALIHLSRQVALQYGKRGIRCNAVAPGLTLSPAGLGMPQAMRDMYVRHNMLSWVAAPDDIAPTIAFLASDMSAYITGQCIQVDGGITGAIPIAADYRDFVAGDLES